MLRVYRGDRLHMRELLIMKPGPDRADVVLVEGENRLVVHDKDAKQLTIEVLPIPK